jgi:hypothetical protein
MHALLTLSEVPACRPFSAAFYAADSEVRPQDDEGWAHDGNAYDAASPRRSLGRPGARGFQDPPSSASDDGGGFSEVPLDDSPHKATPAPLPAAASLSRQGRPPPRRRAATPPGPHAAEEALRAENAALTARLAAVEAVRGSQRGPRLDSSSVVA